MKKTFIKNHVNETIEGSKDAKGKLKSYITGFILSIILTLIPYFVVTNKLLSGAVLVSVLILFAIAQLFVQLIFFLHMKEESKPHLNLVVFISFVGIIIIVVVASIWIMENLNYNMTLIQLDKVMQQGEGF
jgi:cytochrome o ubiquinol oxidase operon protein cyoD